MAKHLGWYRSEQLVLNVTLLGSQPKIWRRVDVHSGLTLREMHYVIQSVFDWTDSHLYQFLVPPGGKLTRTALRNSTIYQDPRAGVFFAGEDDVRQADEELIGRILTPECPQIIYEYDFGDCWQHVVKLEKSTAGGDPAAIPQCLAGENAAPLDDMGGIHGFYTYLEARNDPEDEMHDEAVAWLGEDFDPARFDLDEANRRLASTFQPAPKRPRKPRKKKS